MIDFTTFSSHEKDLLIRLPYRVGMWLSESDAGGGDEAAFQEKQALQSIIIAYAEDFCKSEAAQLIMEQTIRHKDSWDSWNENIESVPDECREAMITLSRTLPLKELSSFKDNLIEIAYSVAMVYREFDDEASFGERLKTYITLWIERLQAFLQGNAIQSQDEILNISPHERKALDELTAIFSEVFSDIFIQQNPEEAPKEDLVQVSEDVSEGDVEEIIEAKS